jgi:hypothetical protein
VEDGEAEGAGAAEDGQHRRVWGADGSLSRPSPPVFLQSSHTTRSPRAMTMATCLAGTAGLAQARVIPCPCRSHGGARGPKHQPGQSPRTQVEEVDNSIFQCLFVWGGRVNHACSVMLLYDATMLRNLRWLICSAPLQAFAAARSDGNWAPVG